MPFDSSPAPSPAIPCQYGIHKWSNSYLNSTLLPLLIHPHLFSPSQWLCCWETYCSSPHFGLQCSPTLSNALNGCSLGYILKPTLCLTSVPNTLRTNYDWKHLDIFLKTPMLSAVVLLGDILKPTTLHLTSSPPLCSWTVGRYLQPTYLEEISANTLWLHLHNPVREYTEGPCICSDWDHLEMGTQNDKVDRWMEAYQRGLGAKEAQIQVSYRCYPRLRRISESVTAQFDV